MSDPLEIQMQEIISRILTGAGGAVVAVLIIAAAEWLFSAMSMILGPPIPNGAVIAFDLKECPSIGWEEYKLAHGRFVRGIDNSGRRIDPDGTRAPGSHQEDSFT